METPLNVLIVEDREDDALLMERALARGGFCPSCRRVETAEEMREALAQGAVQVVLADYSLPCFSAEAALAILQETGRDIPFIVVSGTIGEETAVGMMKAGAHDYLMKGQLTRLPAAIRRELAEAEERRARAEAEAALQASEEQYGALQEELLRTREAQLLEAREDLQAAHLQLIQAARLESVGRLAAGVAHEVKNPLAILLMGVEFLAKKTPPGGAEAEVLADMGNAVQRADAVIRGILDFSSSRGFRRAPEELKEIVERALALVRHETARGRVAVERDFAETLPRPCVDRQKIEQALVNLFMNAIEAMPSGGTLRVRAAVAAGGKAAPGAPVPVAAEAVLVEVEDTGPGILPENLGKIFDPFFTTKPTGKGTGLGLTVAQKIAEMHGGRLEVRNRPEGGVRARLTLPVSPQGPVAERAGLVHTVTEGSEFQVQSSEPAAP